MTSDEPDILRLRIEQIDHMTLQDVSLIQRLGHEDVPTDAIPDRRLDWLVELGVIAVDDGQARLKPDGVVFEPLVSPDGDQDEARYGPYNKDSKLENSELPPDRELRRKDEE